MPARSEKQRRFIYAQAAAGVPWARKFIKDSGHTPPAVRNEALHRLRKKHGRR